LKEKKPVVVINPPVRLKDMIIVESPEEAIKMLEDSLGSS
jgi:hypothetical protein